MIVDRMGFTAESSQMLVSQRKVRQKRSDAVRNKFYCRPVAPTICDKMQYIGIAFARRKKPPGAGAPDGFL